MTADEFAKECGYDGAAPCGKWHGYNAYDPYFDGDGPTTAGYPYLILEKNGAFRMQTLDECLSGMHQGKEK